VCKYNTAIIPHPLGRGACDPNQSKCPHLATHGQGEATSQHRHSGKQTLCVGTLTAPRPAPTSDPRPQLKGAKPRVYVLFLCVSHDLHPPTPQHPANATSPALRKAHMPNPASSICYEVERTEERFPNCTISADISLFGRTPFWLTTHPLVPQVSPRRSEGRSWPV